MSERKIRTFHIPLDRVRQYLTVEEIEACVGGHVKCAIYADVEAGRKLILGNGIRALLGLADSAVDIATKDAEIERLKKEDAAMVQRLHTQSKIMAEMQSENERLKRVIEKLTEHRDYLIVHAHGDSATKVQIQTYRANLDAELEALAKEVKA